VADDEKEDIDEETLQKGVDRIDCSHELRGLQPFMINAPMDGTGSAQDPQRQGETMSPPLRHCSLSRLRAPSTLIPNFRTWRPFGFIIADDGGHGWAAAGGNADNEPDDR
jgi:hypothetical protein